MSPDEYIQALRDAGYDVEVVDGNGIYNVVVKNKEGLVWFNIGSYAGASRGAYELMKAGNFGESNALSTA